MVQYLGRAERPVSDLARWAGEKTIRARDEHGKTPKEGLYEPPLRSAVLQAAVAHAMVMKVVEFGRQRGLESYPVEAARCLLLALSPLVNHS